MGTTIKILLTIAGAVILTASSCEKDEVSQIGEDGSIEIHDPDVDDDGVPDIDDDDVGEPPVDEDGDGIPDDEDDVVGDPLDDPDCPEDGCPDCGDEGCGECVEDCDEGPDLISLGDPLEDDPPMTGTVQVDQDAAGNYLVIVDLGEFDPPEHGWFGLLINGTSEDGTEWITECGFRSDGEPSNCNIFSAPDYTTCGGGTTYPAPTPGEPYVMETGLHNDANGNVIFDYPLRDDISGCTEVGPITVTSMALADYDWDASAGSSGALSLDAFTAGP